MKHNNREVLDYWNRSDVESMYDKHLLNAEIDLLKKRISAKSRVLDVGCGEGEGTFAYSRVEGVTIHAVDFSDTRLDKARLRLAECRNVRVQKCDLLNPVELEPEYDCIVSQRFLINLMEWHLQQKVLRELTMRLRRGGKLMLLEGCVQGVAKLNELRKLFSLEPIPVKWHNLFLDDNCLIDFMRQQDCHLVESDGLGTYFILTRALRPVFEKGLNWDCDFNRQAASHEASDLLGKNSGFSRLKLWVFERRGA